MIFASLITNLTAKVMARTITRHPHLVSFTDVVAHGLGRKSRVWVNLVILVELGGAA